MENYEVDNREEQLKHERFHYDALKPFIVNKNRPFATTEEHKEKEKVTRKKYNQEHHAEIKEKDKVYRDSHKEVRKPKMQI